MDFRLTSFDDSTLVFENPQHDNPRLIRYTRRGDELTAYTEGVENGERKTHTSELRRRRPAD